MFNKGKRESEEQLRQLEETIKDYREKLTDAEETIKRKDKELENIRKDKLSPEEIEKKRQAKKMARSQNRPNMQSKRDINIFALVDAQLDAHKRKEHKGMLETILSDLIMDPLVGYKKDENWLNHLDLVNTEALSFIAMDEELPIDIRKKALSNIKDETIKKELDEQYFNRKLSREEIEANADEGWYGFVNNSR